MPRWPTPLVILLLTLGAFYVSYRAFHLAITTDEILVLTCAHRVSYGQLFLANNPDHLDNPDYPGNWNSQAQFLNALLAKPCVQLLPLNEIVAARLPSLLGLALFLWGLWRIGLEFPTGATRVLITLALLSNAFLLDFFGLSRGYGLALGFTVLSLSFLLQASVVKCAGDQPARRQAGIALWLALGAALSNMAFAFFYTALLIVVLWLSWSNRLKVRWWVNALLLGIFYMPRVLVTRTKNLPFFSGDIGFVHDTVGSLVRCSFYDWPVSTELVGLVSGALALLVWLLAYWSHRERIRAGFILSVLGILVAVLCVATHKLLDVKYLMERTALFLVPLVVLNIGVVAAWSRLGWPRLFLWGLLLIFTGIGLPNANLNHTLNWRTVADTPSVLLALREVHQSTGQDVVLAFGKDRKSTIWYNAEHVLGLHPTPYTEDMPHLRTYDWLTAYDWPILQITYCLPSDHPFVPGTTHLLLDRDDRRLLAAHLAERATVLKFYPNSDMTLYTVTVPERQGTVTYRPAAMIFRPGTVRFPDGSMYAGEFKHGYPNGQGTVTFPDGGKYVGTCRDNMLNGQGTLTFPDGQKFAGEFKDGLLNGQGTARFPDGWTYAGEFKDGYPNGEGTITFPNGGKYVGTCRDRLPNGQGTLTFPDGWTYAGEFKNGNPNDGEGTITFPDGGKYVGTCRDRLPNGVGTITFPDGRKYVGEFRSGEMDGVGKMTYPNGRVDDGLWKQGRFAGAVQ